MSGPTPAELAHAEVAGRWARESGRGLDACPTYALGEQGEPYRAAWKEGWRATDARLKEEGK